jgi:LysM repeat protein
MAAGYEVVPGDTLSSISAQTGVPVATIARANHLADPNRIIAGADLKIPNSALPTSVHEVSVGETLSSIASRYGLSIQALAKANDIVDVNFIVSGERLEIPGRLGSARSAPTHTHSAKPAASSLQPSDPGQVEMLLEQTAAAEGIDSSLVKAVAWQESGWQQTAVSSAGALGVMQVMPGTADYVNESLGGGGLDVTQTEDNIELGVKYLHHVVDSMPSERKGIAAYYTGPGAVGRTLSTIQKTYVNSVQALKDRF